MSILKKILTLGISLTALLALTACGSTAAPIDDPAALVSSDWTKGNAESAVVVMEYGDFQCPACAAYYGLVEEVIADYGDKVQFVYRHFPLTQIHPYALPTAQAAEAAGKQGKFWEMYSILFERQTEWANGGGFDDKITAYATELGLDLEKFNADRKSSEVKDKVRRDMKTGVMQQVGGTPTFLVNGVAVPNPPDAEGFKAILDAALSEAASASTQQ